MAQIDKKQLEGLIFRESVRTTREENGELKTGFTVQERPLEPADILASRKTPAGLIIVTADGQKYTLEKKPAGKGKE